MAAAKGNKNAKGHKGGGGRKSAYQERADAQRLFDAFFGLNDQEAIESRIRSGHYSIWDRMQLTAMEGDTRVMTAMFNKVFPDKHEHSGPLGAALIIEHAPDGGTHTKKAPTPTSSG